MTSDEIRTAFLGFFESKGHKVIPSSSLIPQGDPTLLLTTAGMVQFKPYFLGLETPPNPRLASCQKCFRTTDIERVGDPTHLTFFEMLGNFSIGDYFKKEAIGWAWEFVTGYLKLPVERLWITIFIDDDDAFRYWREVGVGGERIIRMGEATNFWGPAGDSGPCGPCSEIHYDLGEKVRCDEDVCLPGCNCGRYLEIWNLVFTQYNQDKSGKRTLLPKPNIDTGMGLERLTAILQGKPSVYETDIFEPLIDLISYLSGNRYGTNDETDNAIRIVAEHSRGIVFLIGDGVLPSNEGRGYVLRRLLRRAAFFGKVLGLKWDVIEAMVKSTVGKMRHIYPEIEQRENFILEVIFRENTRFEQTLDTGLELLYKIIETATSKRIKEISGKGAFKLHDTFGFPVELTREIAGKRGFAIDMAGFEAEMEKQKERARASHKFETAIPGEIQLDITPTKFVGYKKLKQNTRILGILLKNSPVREVEPGQEAGIILEVTPFYGEMGGQVGDTGEIRSKSGRFEVINAVHMKDIIVHQGKVAGDILSVGDRVEAEVDEERRRDIARNHTATHLLQMALRKVIGEHVQQRGSLVAPDRFSFDFSHQLALTAEEIQKVQRVVNEKIRQDLSVYAEELSYKQAIQEGVIALFDEKYGDIVRVLRIGRPPVSAELCGGTHVSTTGEIGFFYILSEHSIGSGLRRIEAVTGRHAEAGVEKHLSDLRAIAHAVGSSVENVLENVAGTIGNYETERRRVEALEKELARLEAESLLNCAETVDGMKVLAARVSSCSADVLREMGDLLRDRLGSSIVVLGTVYEDKPVFVATVTPDLVVRGYDAGKIVREVARVTGGGGGGKPTLAQGSGKDKTQLDAALRLVSKLVQASS